MADTKQPRHAAPVDQDMPRDAGNPLPNGRPVMTIAPTLQQYMDEQRIRYELVPHEPTLSALGSAHAGHIPSDRLAKAVVLNEGGRYTLAVLPASHHLRLSDLRLNSGMGFTWPPSRKPQTSSATVRSARFRPWARAMGWMSLSTPASTSSRSCTMRVGTTRLWFM